MSRSPLHAARWALRLTLLGLAALSVWALAPAFSATPYRPVPEDFGQPLDPVERVAPARSAHAGEGAVTHLSEVLEAPARFDVAGLSGELRPYELRAREEGSEWSPWTETVAGDPVWFGGAEQLQLRTRGWRPEGRLHYVNVSGDSTPAEAALTAARTEVSHIAVAAVDLVGGEPAVAEPDKPPVISRSEWGAEKRNGGCEPRRRPDYGKVKAAAVHHTVSATKYSRAEAPRMVLAICRFHRNGNGWDDIGYNALVDRFGRLYEGRDGGLGRAVVGAHAQGFNDQTFGIASLGTHTEVELSRAGMAGAADMIAWKLAKHGVTADGRTTLVSGGGDLNRWGKGDRIKVKKVIAHRKLGLTECPGNALYRQLDKLRRKVARRMGGSGGGGGSTGGVG